MQLIFSSLPISNIKKLTTVSENTYSWLPIIYWVGVVLTSTWLLIKLSSVKRQIRRAEKGSAFSFWKTKVIDKSLTYFSAIDAHENIHVRQLHTLDTLLIEIIRVFFWFNPIVYCYSRSLKLVHEYQADAYAASFAESKKQYAMLLFLQSFKAGPILTNSFYNPLLLEARISMLQRKKSNKYRLLKYVLSMPLVVLVIIICSFKSLDFRGMDINKLDQTATFPGGFKAFSEYLVKNTRNVSRKNGRVVVSFTIATDGVVVDEKIDSSLNESSDIEALRVLALSPKWKPALQNGRAVRSAYQLGINFNNNTQ